MTKKPPALAAPTADSPPPPETDRFLRRFGFRIHARPADGPPEWFDLRTHKTMSQELAYKIACERMKGGTA